MSFVIAAVDGAVPLFSREATSASAQWWTSQGASVHVLEAPEGAYDLVIDVEPPDAPRFQIRRERTGESLLTDGTAEQVGWVGHWASLLLPPDHPTEVWLVDQDYTQHVVLTPGITAEEVGRGWVPIED